MVKIQVLKTQNSTIKSKQIDDDTDSLFSNRDNVIEPAYEFGVLLQTYDNSSIISGIIGKIAVKTATPFRDTGSDKLNEILSEIDIETIVLDMLIFGNSYLERLERRNGEKTLDFSHIIAPTIRVANKNTNYDFYQRSEKGKNKVGFYKNEVLQFKRNSISSKHYGDSIFSSSIDEIILLSYITRYFKRYFKSGNINPTIIFDKNDKLTEEQIDKITNLIRDRIAGLDNADNTIFIGSDVGKIDLATTFDPEKYISLKRELKEDIAIDLNIPFDMLSTQSSNRATSLVAMEVLYSDIIIPLQNRIAKQIRNQFKTWFEEEEGTECWKEITLDDINAIEFEDINLKNPKEEMETLTGYQKNGALSVNEVRKIAGLGDEIEGGDEYKVIGRREEDDEEKEMEKIKNDIKKIYEKSNKTS